MAKAKIEVTVKVVLDPEVKLSLAHANVLQAALDVVKDTTRPFSKRHDALIEAVNLWQGAATQTGIDPGAIQRMKALPDFSGALRAFQFAYPRKVRLCYCDDAGRHVHGRNCPPEPVTKPAPCPAHDEHPHNGMTCLDCPVCRPQENAAVADHE